MNFLLTSGAAGEWLDKTFLSFDMGVFAFFGKMGSDFMNVLAKIFSNLGDTKYGIGVMAIALILILFRKTRKVGIAVFFSVLIGLLLTNGIIKPLVHRIRPYNTLQHIPEYFGWYQNAGMMAESDFCFPSGHTTASFEIAISLFLCFRAAGKKKIAWIFPVLGILTGLSRIYLMVHYATDVIAGTAIGILAGIIGYNISRLITQKFSGGYGWRMFDLERVIEEKTGKKITRKAACIAIAAAWTVVFAISLVFMLKAGGDSQRCAYDGDYKCYNEIKEKEEYLIDGQYYCKIHTEELSQK